MTWSFTNSVRAALSLQQPGASAWTNCYELFSHCSLELIGIVAFLPNCPADIVFCVPIAALVSSCPAVVAPQGRRRKGIRPLCDRICATLASPFGAKLPCWGRRPSSSAKATAGQDDGNGRFLGWSSVGNREGGRFGIVGAVAAKAERGVLSRARVVLSSRSLAKEEGRGRPALGCGPIPGR